MGQRGIARPGRLVLALLLAAGLTFIAGCRAGRAPGPAPAPGANGTPGQGQPGSPGAAEGGAGQEEPGKAPPKTTKVTVYFSDEQAMYLRPAAREVPADRPAAGIVEALLAGPGPGETGLRPTFPAGTRLRGVKLEGGVATVDFSQELVRNFGGGSAGELMLVYSLVNSLTQLPGVHAVRLSVEGKPLETLGHLDLTEPVTPRPDLVRN